MDLNSKVDKLVNQSATARENNNNLQEENVLLRSGIEFPIKNNQLLDEMEQFLASPENYKSVVSSFYNNLIF